LFVPSDSVKGLFVRVAPHSFSTLIVFPAAFFSAAESLEDLFPLETFLSCFSNYLSLAFDSLLRAGAFYALPSEEDFFAASLATTELESFFEESFFVTFLD